MYRLTFFKTMGSLDATARASGTPIPWGVAHANAMLEQMVAGKYTRLWLPMNVAMGWRHPDLNARNTTIDFLGKIDATTQWAVHDRLPNP
jgi:hypothetical protein